MSTAFSDLLTHLDSHDVKYITLPDEVGVGFVIPTSTATYSIAAQVESDSVQFRFQFPIRIPAGSRSDVCQAITRANFGLKMGSFQLDLEDGELVFNVFNLLVNERLPDEIAERIIGTSLSMIGRYGHAFLAVVYGNEDPKQAIKHVESSRETFPPGEALEEDSAFAPENSSEEIGDEPPPADASHSPPETPSHDAHESQSLENPPLDQNEAEENPPQAPEC